MTNPHNSSIPLERLLRQAEKAPSLPAVALEVLRISQDEAASLDDLAEVIIMDPSLSARLMRYANSSLFNAGSEVTTIQRAAMLLGLKTVQLMALSFSLTDSIPRVGESSFDFQRFWRRSTIRAVAARNISQASGSLMPDESFLCGLLSEFGQVVLSECCGATYDEVVAKSNEGQPQCSVEQAVLGFDHVDALEHVLQAWGFPPSICSTMSCALRDEEISRSEEPVRYSNAKVLQLACQVADILTLESPSTTLGQLEQAFGEHLNLGASVVEELLNSLEKGVLELDQLLGLELPKGKSIGEVLDLARKQQVSLAMQADSRSSIGAEIHAELSEGMDAADEVHGEDTFEYYLNRSLEARLEGGPNFPIGLLYIDINNVEELPSEAPLGELGLALGQVVRKTDLWARISEGQFGVIINECTPIGLRRLAERVRQVLREIETRDEISQAARTQITIGGACLGPVESTDDGEQLKNLARQLAGKALSKAGGACYVHPQQLRSRHSDRRAG